MSDQKEIISEIRTRIQLLITVGIFFLTFLLLFYKAIGSDEITSGVTASVWGIGVAFSIINYFIIGIADKVKVQTLVWIRRLVSINALLFVLPIIILALVLNDPLPGYYLWPFMICLVGTIFVPIVTFFIIAGMACWQKLENKTTLYFAYGSNMKTRRLVDRVGKVKIVGKSLIEDHQLTFDKLGDNGSGKTNICPQNGPSVEGVLFDLTKKQIKKLDHDEGVNNHYIRCTRDIKIDGKLVVAEVYFANENKLKDGLKPTCKYLQYLIDGADEHGLSSDYKKFIKSFPCKKIGQ